MRKSEDLEIEQENSDEEGIYNSLSDLDLQGKKSVKAKGNTDKKGIYVNLCDLDLWRRKKDAKAKAAKKAKYQLILILVVLFFLFLILVVLIGIMFASYKSMAEEQTHLREADVDMAKKLLGLRDTGVADFLCGKEWKYYYFSCYYKSTNTQTWDSAKEDCEKKKADLVIIDDEDEMDFLRDISENQYWWIGLRKVNGTWEWSDGTSYEMTTEFWGKGQPNNSSMKGFPGGQDCVQFSNEKGWDDRQCAIKYKYICEKDIS